MKSQLETERDSQTNSAASPSIFKESVGRDTWPARYAGLKSINDPCFIASHQWTPNKPVESQISSSGFSLSEGQTRERQRSYNGSVKQRRAPLFTGAMRRYMVQSFV
jgi:hypothetical protein